VANRLSNTAQPGRAPRSNAERGAQPASHDRRADQHRKPADGPGLERTACRSRPTKLVLISVRRATFASGAKKLPARADKHRGQGTAALRPGASGLGRSRAPQGEKKGRTRTTSAEWRGKRYAGFSRPPATDTDVLSRGCRGRPLKTSRGVLTKIGVRQAFGTVLDEVRRWPAGRNRFVKPRASIMSTAPKVLPGDGRAGVGGSRGGFAQDEHAPGSRVT